MLFFAANDGSIVKSLQGNIYQGSANANTFTLIAPFAENTSITIAFKLPNGVWTSPVAMTPQNALQGIVSAATGQTYAGWTYDLPNSITSLAGDVTAQFFVYNAQGKITATSAVNFTVQTGVPAVLPDTPSEDVYESILSVLASLQGNLASGAYVARAVFPWHSTTTYGANEIVFVPVGEYGAEVQSVQAGNTNNPPYDAEGNLNTAWWREVVNYNTVTEDFFGKIKEIIANADQDFGSAVEDAQTAAQQAASSATEAAGSATAAGNSASDAAESAINAQAYAEQAKSYAQKKYVIYPTYEDLPRPGDGALIYLVPAPEPSDGYSEYLWIANKNDYEFIGRTEDIDLTNYAQIDGTYPEMTVGSANDPNAVHFTSQTLTDEQKLQARKNIYAAAEEQALKNMYNLGAYDTFTDNGNGTATITRKTGYVRIDGSQNWTRWGSDGAYFYTKTPQAAYLDSNARGCVGSNPELSFSGKWSAENCFWVYPYGNNGWGSFFAINIDGVTSPETCKAYFAQHPTYVQYELATSYTEEVILDQPIHTLDVNGEQFVRYQYEHGLYFSDNNTSPASIFGGDWTSLGSFSSGGNTIYVWKKNKETV